MQPLWTACPLLISGYVGYFICLKSYLVNKRWNLSGFPLSFVCAAPLSDTAVTTFRLPCLADIPAVQYQPMMSLGCDFSGDMSHEGFLRSQRGLGIICQTDPVADAKHMGIDCHRRLVPYYSKHDIGCFTPYSRKLHKIVNIGGHLPSELLLKHFRRPDKMTCLVVGKRHTADIRKDLLFCGSRQRRRIRIGFKQRGRDHIHPFVCTLG